MKLKNKILLQEVFNVLLFISIFLILAIVSLQISMIFLIENTSTKISLLFNASSEMIAVACFIFLRKVNKELITLIKKGV